MMAARGAALLNAVLILITFALLSGLMANFLGVGNQGMGEQVQSSQAYYLAVSGASCVDGNSCPPLTELNFDDQGKVTIDSAVRVTARVGNSQRILEKNGAGWREVDH